MAQPVSARAQAGLLVALSLLVVSMVALVPRAPVGADGNEAPESPSVLRELTAGNHFVCAVLDDGGVKCWGHNDEGQLGLGDATDRLDGRTGRNLPRIDLGSGRTATAVVAGLDHACALLDNGNVKCWGGNSGGQLGLGDMNSRGDDPGEMGDALPAVDLGAGRTAAAVTAGGRYTCALLDDDTVKCWGRNHKGQLGLGDVISRGDHPGEMGDNLPAVDLGLGRTATAVTASEEFGQTCALLDNADLKCWGNNWDGELGQGDSANRGDEPGEMGDNLAAVHLGTGRSAVAVSMGVAHACALLDEGSVKCWGLGQSGALGLGDLAQRGDDPGEMGDNLPPVDLGAGRTAIAIAAGYTFTCALLDNGGVKCWGENGQGQLGQGDTADRGDDGGEMGDNLAAVSLGTSRSATAVTVGGYEACARLDSGAVKCWGYNEFGQLGVGDADSRGDAPGEMGDDLAAARLEDFPDSDVTPPSVSLLVPANGAIYNPNQVVGADFSCDDGTDSSGIEACEGTAPDGQPIATSVPGVYQFSVTATDRVGNTQTVTNTYTVRSPQPDGRIKLGLAGTYFGDNIYNLTAVSQTRRGSGIGGQTVTYYVSVQNDAPFGDQMRLRGTASTARFRVLYSTGGFDTTAAVTGGSYLTPSLAPGRTVVVKIEVKVRGAAPVGASFTGTLTATSMTDTSMKDRVRFETRRR